MHSLYERFARETQNSEHGNMMMIQQAATLHSQVDWKAAISAGLISGVALLIMEMILMSVTGTPLFTSYYG